MDKSHDDPAGLCRDCSENVEYTKGPQVVQLPDILILDLTGRTKERPVKISQSVDTGSGKYRLLCWISYRGDATRGHYYVVVKEGSKYIAYGGSRPAIMDPTEKSETIYARVACYVGVKAQIKPKSNPTITLKKKLTIFTLSAENTPLNRKRNSMKSCTNKER